MLRTILCASLGLVLTAGNAAAQRGNPQGSKDPIQPPKNVKELHGKIVKIDFDKDLVTVRFGDGDVMQEDDFLVTKDTKYFGKQRQPLDGGLRNTDLKQGTEVWFQTGVGERFRTILEVRLYNPALTPQNTRPTNPEHRPPG